MLIIIIQIFDVIISNRNVDALGSYLCPNKMHFLLCVEHTVLTYFSHILYKCVSVCTHAGVCMCVCVYDFVGCMYWHRLGSNWFPNMVTALFKKGSSQSE